MKEEETKKKQPETLLEKESQRHPKTSARRGSVDWDTRTQQQVPRKSKVQHTKVSTQPATTHSSTPSFFSIRSFSLSLVAL